MNERTKPHTRLTALDDAQRNRTAGGGGATSAFFNMPRGREARAEDFGRYDPVTHTLLIDRKEQVPLGRPKEPIALAVGPEGRLNAVLKSRDQELITHALQCGAPPVEPDSVRHAMRRHTVDHPEKLGRYDPISSTLRFEGWDGDHSVRVGQAGRLRAILDSGFVDKHDAKALGLPGPFPIESKRTAGEFDPGFFNPLTHEYHSSSSPRDRTNLGGRRTVCIQGAKALSPRLNPLTLRLDPINSTSVALRAYNPQSIQSTNFRVTHMPQLIAGVPY